MPWVSSTVVTREPKGTIRLCLDSRDLNGATRRTPYYVRTIDDIIPKVSGASHFSILDSLSGFWQVNLMTKAANSATPVPHWESTYGKGCHLDLSAVKMFQKRYFRLWQKWKRHYQHILNVLDTAKDNNVRFNPDMVQFKVDQTSFWGFTWTPDGLGADDHKIKPINNMPSHRTLLSCRPLRE